jgi:hypothetical protein
MKERRRDMKRMVWIGLLGLLLAGCAPQYTTFKGDAKIKDGPSGCEAKCRELGMELAGMVVLGEYTDGCICKKKDAQISMQDIGETVILSSPGAGGGTVGVETDLRLRESHAVGGAAAAGFSGGIGF